jgi:RND superfamily putative drug exporter
VAARGTSGTITNVVAPALERLPNVAAGTATHLHRDLWVFNIKTVSPPFAVASLRLVRSIRALPFHLAVTGATASFLDTETTLERYAPVAVTILIGLTLVLLFVATGSAILPWMAVAINLLTFASALGAVVFVFQDGRFTGLLDYRGMGALLVTQPALLAAGAFGILTDYGVFMLTRIREGWDASLSADDAVVRGLERTGPVISSAALLLCVAVGALTTAKMVFVKELGFGIVVAVIIDVTVVRALLLPAVMVALRRSAWWRPQLLSLRGGGRTRMSRRLS